jgi:hypothetical protein
MASVIQPRFKEFISDVRIGELRGLASAQFDFRKLIRLCEEINSSYSAGRYFATAMLTRGLFDNIGLSFPEQERWQGIRSRQTQKLISNPGHPLMKRGKERSFFPA